jgi:DNA-binding CsgD family transcriptional regulator
MTRLSERDIRSALELVYDAASMTGPEPFPREVLERLAQLIPADAIVGYRDELVVSFPYRVVELIEVPENPIPPEIQKAASTLCHQDPLRLGPRRRERRAVKLSDFLTRRQMHKLGFYDQVWKPLGIDDSLRAWLPAPQGRGRQIYLERGKRDFTERDRSILELLRPFLARIQTAAYARRHRKEADVPPLTEREQEILAWIARGKTSREIAAILVVSPYTVRKHVEHILEKLNVATRSAAVARAFPHVDSRGVAPAAVSKTPHPSS